MEIKPNFETPKSESEVPDGTLPTTQPTPETEQELTIGQKLVGISFNPSGSSKIDRAKALCAELTDLLLFEVEGKSISMLHRTLLDHTLGEILNAQMNVVKVLTFKH